VDDLSRTKIPRHVFADFTSPFRWRRLSLPSYFSVKRENNMRRDNAIAVTATIIKIKWRKTMKKFQTSLKLGGALLMALTSLFALPDRSSAQGKRKNSFTAPPQ